LLLKNEPDRSLLHFDWILGYFSHGHILSRVCASGKFGPVHYVLAMVAVVVGVDVLFFRNRLWERLMVNVGVVLVFGAFYLRFLKRP
jgi:hypothetical protein